ncbi:MAG: hypothetical protein GXP06_06825, partial [Alphaproteobacteria bacterium]|nr:hypothetical protein [Alphaproteobacteria bacterium]
GGRLNGNLLAAGFAVNANKVAASWSRIAERAQRIFTERKTALAGAARVLETVSYARVLERGFALVRNEAGVVIRRAGDVAAGARGQIQFADGARDVAFGGGATKPKTPPAKPSAKSPSKPKANPRQAPRQQRLFD